jgi:hypothetical protein
MDLSENGWHSPAAAPYNVNDEALMAARGQEERQGQQQTHHDQEDMDDEFTTFIEELTSMSEGFQRDPKASEVRLAAGSMLITTACTLRLLQGHAELAKCTQQRNRIARSRSALTIPRTPHRL